MKRPGDKQSPSIQRANKFQKTVTFSLPHQSPPPSLVSNSNTSSPSTKSNLNTTMTGGNHNHNHNHTQPQSSRSHGDNHSTTMDNTNHNPNRRASILRSTSTSNSSKASPRFTFYFVDDTSLGTSTIASKKSYNSSPNNRPGSKLSPTRLDARYSSRLPPSYGHGYSPSHQSYTSANNEEEIRRTPVQSRRGRRTLPLQGQPIQFQFYRVGTSMAWHYCISSSVLYVTTHCDCIRVAL